MIELISLPEHEYLGLVKRAEQSIRAEFDSPDITALKANELIREAILLGCTPNFIHELDADLQFIK